MGLVRGAKTKEGTYSGKIEKRDAKRCESA